MVGEDAIEVGGLAGRVGGERAGWVEIREGRRDFEAGGGEERGDLRSVEPAEGLGRAVLARGIAGQPVAVVAGEGFGNGIDLVTGVEPGAAAVGKDGLVVVIPAAGRKVAMDLGEGDEKREVESAAGSEPAVPVAEGGGGIRCQLEGEGRREEGGIGRFRLPGGHVRGDQPRCRIRETAAEEIEHVGGQLETVELESLLEERSHETAGAAADFQGGARVLAEKCGHQGDFRGVVLGVPKRVMEFRFEREVGLHGGEDAALTGGGAAGRIAARGRGM